ncbi:MAG TPA: site-2 protease family protein [Ktedonobacterales bacterium]|nr:site-2 protease family protein [Ktedonobacterales bacterium]
MINVALVLETLLAFVIVITLHESAHAAMAALLGDGMAVGEGRLSVNPARQVAPLGLLVAGVLAFAPTYTGIGWGKPVRYDSTRLRVGPNVGTILVALAGPLLNLLVGLAIALGLRYVPGYVRLNEFTNSATGRCGLLNYVNSGGQALEHCLAAAQPAWELRLEQFAIVLALTSLVVALVNVLPLYPFDGYKVLFALLPDAQAVAYRRWEPYMEAIVLAIFFVLPFLLNLLGIGFSPAVALRDLANLIFGSLSGGPDFLFAQLL